MGLLAKLFPKVTSAKPSVTSTATLLEARVRAFLAGDGSDQRRTVLLRDLLEAERARRLAIEIVDAELSISTL